MPQVIVEEAKASEETDDLPEIFRKHRLMKLTKYENFRVQDCRFLDQFEFSWDIHGQERFSQFLPNQTKCVSQLMNQAYTMTNGKFADTTVETDDYRMAIMFYLKEIHGIRDVTFKYKKINDMFEKEQKIYIKKIMCSPDQVTFQDYKAFNSIAYDSEKCHVNILAMETKR